MAPKPVDQSQIDFTDAVTIESEKTDDRVEIPAFHQVLRARRMRITSDAPLRITAGARLRITK